MSLQKRQELEIVVVRSEGVQQRLGHLEPADVEEELKKGEDRDVEIDAGFFVILLGGVQELLADEGEQEEAVHGDRHDLWTGGKACVTGELGGYLFMFQWRVLFLLLFTY